MTSPAVSENTAPQSTLHPRPRAGLGRGAARGANPGRGGSRGGQRWAAPSPPPALPFLPAPGASAEAARGRRSWGRPSRRCCLPAPLVPGLGVPNSPAPTVPSARGQARAKEPAAAGTALLQTPAVMAATPGARRSRPRANTSKSGHGPQNGSGSSSAPAPRAVPAACRRQASLRVSPPKAPSSEPGFSSADGASLTVTLYRSCLPALTPPVSAAIAAPR